MTHRSRDIRGIPPPVPKPAAFDIRAAARELLGADWQQPLAIMLGVNLRTVQRWANGQNACPKPIAARIGELLAIARRSRSDAAADRARRLVEDRKQRVGAALSAARRAAEAAE
jgi:hypothetical protein